jgi:sporulation protein YabP
MVYEMNTPQAEHRLELFGRRRLTVTGVEDVERFDDSCIVLATCVGTMIISGEELHIGKLSLDGGELHVDGQIDAVTYEDAPAAQRGSLLSRLFG